MQKVGRTVQGVLQEAVCRIIPDATEFRFSGRTDTGVHAREQCVSFLTSKSLECRRTLKSLNAIFPVDLWANSLCSVDTGFDPRRFAVSRHYKYLFSNDSIPDYLKSHVVYVPFEPDMLLCEQVTKLFLGEKDFVNFRKTGSNEATTVRKITHFEIVKREIEDIYDKQRKIYYYEASIVSSSFLYRMVRNIMGAVFLVLRKKKTLEELKKLIRNEAVKFPSFAAPAKGLTLFKVEY